MCGDRHCPACAPVHGQLGEPVCATCASTLPAVTPAPAPRSVPRGPLALGVAVALGVGAYLLWPSPPPVPVDPTEELSRAVAELAAVDAAVDAWRAEHGAWPASLAEVGGPSDPFAPSRPLRFGPAPARAGALTLWSVGPDGIDQGGSPLDPVTGRGDLALPLE